MSNKLTLLLVAAFPIATAFSQSTRPGYDVEFIGVPLADPILQHSKEQYVLYGCAYCHGVNLESRGEATDLMHSRLVGRDVNGNVIGPLLRAGIPQTAKLSPMPQFSDLSDQQISTIARWIHYARQQGRFKELMESKDSEAGDAVAGKAYFEQNCKSCHPAPPKAGKVQLLYPKFLSTAISFKVDQLHDANAASARQKHLSLLETYSREDVANLDAYLQAPR
jgi:cytochrome c oxidase cbb3-type subunit 3